MNKPLSIVFLLLSFLNYAQDNGTIIPLNSQDLQKETKLDLKGEEEQQKNDSLTLINHREATLIDSLWLNSMYNSPIFDNNQFVLSTDKIVDEERNF